MIPSAFGGTVGVLRLGAGKEREPAHRAEDLRRVELLVELVLDDGAEKAGLCLLEVDDTGRNRLPVGRAGGEAVPRIPNGERPTGAGPDAGGVDSCQRRGAIGAQADHSRRSAVRLCVLTRGFVSNKTDRKTEERSGDGGI